ncbi:MAG: phage integrase SAM-like domain-containing protein [Crocinitomicaceae bacterium]|nr:phage integrase SAM-like domain-containing protein [Crocinitomicaceae bacterium]
MDYNTAIVLDTRRKKKSGVYPVKLRVYSITSQTARLYTTQYDLSKKEFESVWQTEKPRKEYKNLRNEIQAIELDAVEVCKTLKPFSFPEFERKFFRNKGAGADIVYHYNQTIEKLTRQKSIGTASNYELSLKSLKAFVKHAKGKEPEKIKFTDITPDWLNKYEDYMVSDLKRTQTTVGIYLRPLRAIFNKAMAENEITPEIYPFGAKKYQIPTGRNTKKALAQKDLKALFEAQPIIPEQIKARDFWFFSYSCNGMNVKDIAQLRYADLKEDELVFYRAKTIKTSKTNLKPVNVFE